MSADEAGTQTVVTRAMRYAAELMEVRGGRIVNKAGDAFLAEFPSVVEAVSFASEFQTRDRDALDFRIGINLGDIIAAGDDIFGEGVNVAARVEALAPPGGIAITAVVREQLGNRVDIAFEDNGEHYVKNIPGPIRVFVATPPFRPAAPNRPASHSSRKRFAIAAVSFLLAAALIPLGIPELAKRFDRGTERLESNENRPFLAVLPFREEGTGSTYFSDGFTEDIITHLGRFPEILVLSWNAVAPYRDRGDPELLRNELNARYVIGGSLRRSGERLRVTVQLTDARDGVLLWSDRYEAKETDIFEVQDEITGAAAGSLALGVARLEEQAALERPTDELDAYDFVLRGRASLRRVDRASNLIARGHFKAALELDPEYADARAGLAWTYTNEASWGWTEWPLHAIEMGILHARAGLDTSPQNIAALSVLAELYWMRNDFESATEFCKRAVEANPNDARAHAACGGVLIYSGQVEEGIAQSELALRLDPAPALYHFTSLAVGYYVTGRYEDAVSLLSRASNNLSEDPSPHAVLAATYARLDRMEAARHEVEETLRRSPFFDASIFAENISGTGHEEEILEGLRAAGFE
jgi:TolB-like protein/Tfp pilus assembly protein PilF